MQPPPGTPAFATETAGYPNGSGRSSLVQPLAAGPEIIANEIIHASHVLESGQRIWLDPDSSRAAPRAISPHLYDGAVGLGLLFAKVAELSGPNREIFGSVALETLTPIRAKLLDLVSDTSRADSVFLAIGGFVGLGGFFYAFAHIARSLDDASLLADALRIVDLLTDDRIAADQSLDIVGGTAGALAGLLTLIERLESAGQPADVGKLIDKARLCGDHLLASRVRWKQGPRAWPGRNGQPPLGGFAHGASGIGLALLRLARRTQDARYSAAALEGFEFERTLYRADRGTWLDPRTGRPLEQSAWCHGAPGIALSRARARALVADDEAVESDLKIALQHTLAQGEKELDHLCCGNAGDLEIALRAGGAAGLDHARRLAERVEARGPRFDRDRTEIEAREPSFSRPSLLLGAAGWGWALLTLVSPESTPSLLTLE